MLRASFEEIIRILNFQFFKLIIGIGIIAHLPGGARQTAPSQGQSSGVGHGCMENPALDWRTGSHQLAVSVHQSTSRTFVWPPPQTGIYEVASRLLRHRSGFTVVYLCRTGQNPFEDRRKDSRGLRNGRRFERYGGGV